jgi:hypothetical protein
MPRRGRLVPTTRAVPMVAPMHRQDRMRVSQGSTESPAELGCDNGVRMRTLASSAGSVG